MRNFEHGITLSIDGQKLANEPAIAAMTRRILDDEQQYPSVVLSETFFEDDALTIAGELHASSYFDSLNGTEQHAVVRALDLINDLNASEAEWGIIGDSDPDGLFDHYTTSRRVKAASVDALILAGATALDIERIQPSFSEKWSEFGFYSRYDFMQFMGASVIQPTRLSRATENLVYDGSSTAYELVPGVKRITTLGADIHGDFRIAQEQAYTGKSVTPLGRQADFAPTDRVRLAAGYHSVEASLLSDCLVHAHGALPLEDSQLLVQIALDDAREKLDAAAENVIIPFGDYGVEDHELELVTELMYADLRRQQPGSAGDDLVVRGRHSSGPHTSLPLLSVSRGESWFLVNRTDFKSDEQAIELIIGELPDFIASLITQASLANSRTDAASLVSLLQAYKHFLHNQG